MASAPAPRRRGPLGPTVPDAAMPTNSSRYTIAPTSATRLPMSCSGLLATLSSQNSHWCPGGNRIPGLDDRTVLLNPLNYEGVVPELHPPKIMRARLAQAQDRKQVRPLDLPTQNCDLVAEGENLKVALGV